MHDVLVTSKDSARLADRLEVVLIGGERKLGRLVGDAVRALGADEGWSLRRVAAAERLKETASGNAAVCVLDSRDGTALDIESWCASGLPLILIVGDGERERGLRAILDGAQDYIEAHELAPSRLRQAIECAVQRYRFAQLDGEMSADDRPERQPSIGDSDTTISAQLYGLGELRDRLPGDYRFLMAEYKGILERAMADAGMESVTEETRERLRALIERLGAMRATPRDIVDVHTRALNLLLRGATDDRSIAVGKEARILLLEAVGYLAYYYRRYSVQQA